MAGNWFEAEIRDKQTDTMRAAVVLCCVAHHVAVNNLLPHLLYALSNLTWQKPGEILCEYHARIVHTSKGPGMFEQRFCWT